MLVFATFNALALCNAVILWPVGAKMYLYAKKPIWGPFSHLADITAPWIMQMTECQHKHFYYLWRYFKVSHAIIGAEY